MCYLIRFVVLDLCAGVEEVYLVSTCLLLVRLTYFWGEGDRMGGRGRGAALDEMVG